MKVKQEFLEFEIARNFIRSLKLKNGKEWKKYSLTQKPKNIPACPNTVYRQCGWIDMRNWLGIQGHGKFKYSVNDHYFKNWSHDMAYILGLWFADGHIIDNNRFGITLHVQDKYLLENILNRMQSNYPIYMKTSECYFFEVTSEEIVKDIIKLGGKHRKSLDVEFPIIPDKYLPDFIRGLWDGDGSIWYSKPQRLYKSSVCSGSKDFILKLHKILSKNIPYFRSSIQIINIKKGSPLPNDAIRKKDGKLYVINLSINNTIRLRNYIYRNDESLNMTRKREKFEKCGQIRTVSRWDRQFVSLKDFKGFIRGKGFKKYKEWRAYLKSSQRPSNQRPSNIPAAPEVIYKKDWTGWKSVLNYS